MNNPETFFQTVRQKIKPSWVTVFVSVFLSGLLAHAYAFFNYIPNWDSVISYYSDQNTIHLGRCFLTIACGISSYYDLSWLNGFLSLCYLTISAILICELLQIKKNSSLVLFGALLAAFPSVTSTFGYLYTADGYMLAMLCMTLAIYLTLKHRFGFLPGALLLMFGFGCYQAYITFAAMLVIVYSLDELLHRDTPLSTLGFQWLRALLCAVLGYALYAVVNRILLAIQHVTLADYQGVSALGGSGSGFAPLTAAKQCLVDFAYFFTGSLDRMNAYSILNLCMLALLLFDAAARIVRRRLWRSPARLCFVLLFALLIPFACYAIYFLTPDVSYHMLMQGSLYFVYILLLILYDRAQTAGAPPASDRQPQKAAGVVWQWLCVIVCALLVYQFILTANICYRTQETSVSRSMNEIARLADRIAADPSLRECDTIAVIGTRAGNDRVSLNLPPDMTGFSDGYIMTHALHYSLLLERYHGLSFSPMDDEQLPSLSENDIVRDMPCYPEDGYIRAVSGTLVIKFSDEP
ncbi:MAG: glucosyltransferase domain-containing protein [Clostridium sp.]|nr:glucosyltransferase domain-containing protein [Clostridium sp.]